MKRDIILLYIFVALTLVFLPCVYAASPASLVNKANKLYRQKKYDEALKLYNQLLTNGQESAIIQYDKGTAEYKKNDFQGAALSFGKSLATQDKLIEQRANFNLGNAKYKLAELAEKENLEQAVKSLEEAVNYYKRSIELDPSDNSAKFNYELADKLLKELKEKLKKQKQQQKQQQQQQQQGGEQKDKQQENKGEGKEQGQEAEKQQNKNKQQEQKQPQPQAGSQSQENQKKPAEATGSQENNSQEMSRQEARMLLEGRGADPATVEPQYVKEFFLRGPLKLKGGE